MERLAALTRQGHAAGRGWTRVEHGGGYCKRAWWMCPCGEHSWRRYNCNQSADLMSNRMLYLTRPKATLKLLISLSRSGPYLWYF